MTVTQDLMQLSTLADLKALPVASGTKVFIAGKATVGDGLGGFYYWDANSNAAEDTTYLNVVASLKSATGRWVRMFQRARNYPQGVMVTNANVKTFYASAVTDANGDCTITLTDDNTPSGNPLFTDIWFNDSKATITATGPANSVTSYVKTLAANLKSTTHGYFRANAVTVTLGLLYNPFSTVGAGVPVQFRIDGI